MRHLKDNLLVQFSVISFLIVAVVAVVIAVVLSNKIQSDAIEDLVKEAVGASSGRLLTAITPADLEAPMTGARYNRFHEFVQQSIVSERTARVKIVRVGPKEGTIIYSNDQASVGKTFPPPKPLLKAMRGETVPILRVPEGIAHAAERDLGTLMEVVTPIIFPGTTEPQGVFALYQYYAPTAERITSLRSWLFGSIGVGFVILYGGLVSVVWGGWRTISSQQRRLESFNAELKEHTQGLARSNEELEQFAYVASHDLQEPLRMVASYTQLLAKRYKGKLDSDADEFIAYAVDGATRMKELINGLLAYSRLSSQGNSLEPSDCSAIFDQVPANLQAAVRESEAVVTRDALPTVMGDALQLGQLFQNLVGNAIKFHGEDPPRVHVSAERKDKEWLFSVRDNGIGMDTQYADRIFVIFQRLHSGTEYPGAGIGLAICKKIVDRHGGRIWVESKPGKGATFYFTISAEGDNQA